MLLKLRRYGTGYSTAVIRYYGYIRQVLTICERPDGAYLPCDLLVGEGRSREVVELQRGVDVHARIVGG